MDKDGVQRPESRLRGKSAGELTVLSVSLGLAIAIVMTAANVYLGLYAGMTVSASIPAEIGRAHV